MSDLVDRLRDGVVYHPKRWSGDTHDDLGGSVNEVKTDATMFEAADEIDRLQAIVGVLEKTVINTVISTPLIGNDVTIHSKTEAECQELMTLFVQLRITTKAAAEAAKGK